MIQEIGVKIGKNKENFLFDVEGKVQDMSLVVGEKNDLLCDEVVRGFGGKRMDI